MPRTMYLSLVARGVVVFDGAMGTSIQQRNPTPADYGGVAQHGCHDRLVLSRPDLIRDIHESFLAAGCDVIETCTFQATPHRLGEWGLRDDARAINVAAARLARAACERYSTPDRPRLVAGSLGPTGMLPSSGDPLLSAMSFGELSEEYYQQAAALVDGGVDLLLLETAQDMLEVKAAIAGFERLFAERGLRVPVQVQMTVDANGRMLLGTDMASALATLEALPVDVVGLNCGTGPDLMREPLRYLASHAGVPISVLPNAGIPIDTGRGEAEYPVGPEGMAETLAQFVRDLGVRAVGGCCGTTPAHIRALADAIRMLPTAARARVSREPCVSSALRAVTLRQDPPPLIIGERINAQGSRAVKRMLLADDYDGIVEVARAQAEAGAHVLDVCVALTERADEAEQMAIVAKRLSASVEAPLAIDTTDPVVLARALEHVPGRAVINSINMEDGRSRIDRVLPLAKRHGAALIALCIDERGMARTRQHKLEVAQIIHDIVVGEYGLPADALIFDPLTFTLATGGAEWAESAIETIEGLRLIKRTLPGVSTVLGVSNVSFGLPPAARAVLNSVFLHHCVEAGLDAAIVNPAQVTPYFEIPEAERQLADALVFNRGADALPQFVAHFERDSVPGTGPATARDDTAGLSPDEKVHWMIVHRRKDGIEAALDAASVREDPVRVLNAVLLPAMKDVGDKFAAGELILPFVLQSAEVMKQAVRYLEPFLDRATATSRGTVVLATVYGDVHDIGKSLVATILSNNGYTVHDLGKQAPVNGIIDKAIELKADAIGLSALLVSTSKQMTLCVQELDRRGMHIPVLIGGAAINRRFGRRALFVEEGRTYGGGVFYCKDAFEGLRTVAQLTDPAVHEEFVRHAAEEARHDLFLEESPGTGALVDVTRPRSAVRIDSPVPHAPFFGTRVERGIPLAEVFELLDLDSLFRLQWGGRGSGAPFEATVSDVFAPTLARLQAAAAQDRWLRPEAVYGIFPAQADGDAVVVYDAAGYEANGVRREIARFHFPRQDGAERLCLADYFRPVASGEVDVVAVQVVTAGSEATAHVDELQSRGEYADAYYAHGLAVATAEAAAEWMHRRIRAMLRLPGVQGKRYSWGYGACPDLRDHGTVFQLLPAESALGLQLTSAFELVPEQSTAALVVHHPDAKYYSIRR